MIWPVMTQYSNTLNFMLSGIFVVYSKQGQFQFGRTKLIIIQLSSAPNMQQPDHERYFNDFISRIQITDPHILKVDIDSLRSQHKETAADLIKNPTLYYRLAKNLLERNLQGEQKRRFEDKVQHYNISFEGNLGPNFVTPRGMTSKLANQLVGVQGIITKMDIVKYYLEKSVHYCQKTKSHQVKQYPDNLNPQKDFEPNKTRFIKTHDDNNNPLSLQYGLSSFRNIQNVVIQELPEMAPPGLLPQSVTVVLQGKLVNSVKPGDRVQMIGIYKLIGGAQSKEKGIFKPYFICLSVKQLSQTLLQGTIPKSLPFPESQIVGYCSRSVAPSIFGHEQLKKAVLMMLVGGEQKNLENGTHLRGDINLLMVGDPGTAKSQILRWVMATAELAIGTTGSGASGVGLTAAVVTDKDTGQKTLQAGAMVLADRGVVCIDEFDKMNEIDRVAVHEVMQQQTVTIAKAGMHCSLNARCSVIAAANPIYGEYQTQYAPTKNIGMPDSLLSRFDLVFIIFDEKSAEKDKKIAERVTRNHRLAPKTNETFNQFHQDDDYIIHPNEHQNKNDSNTIFQKNNMYQSDTKSKQILVQSFLRRYISHCKHEVHPQLSDQAIQLLSHMWNLLRQEDFNQKNSNKPKVLPITIRSFETLIRLSTAHAKLHRAKQIQVKDCVQAFRLMIYCLYGDCNALDDKLREIMKSLNLDEGTQFGRSQQRSIVTKAVSKKETKKMQDETVVLVQKVSKIDLNQDEKEAEAVIKAAMANQNPDIILKKESISLVYKTIVNLKNHLKINGTGITLIELRKSLDGKMMGSQEIGLALKQLSDNGKIIYEQETRRIFI